MKAVLQRVKRAALTADGVPHAEIGEGLVILLGVMKGDSEDDARRLSDKIAALRIFSDDEGRMNRSLLDVGGAALVVSNFTLAANYRHGNRPDYFDGAAPDEAKRLYAYFVSLMEAKLATETGVFGADMQISAVLDGPVTITMDSEVLRSKR